MPGKDFAYSTTALALPEPDTRNGAAPQRPLRGDARILLVDQDQTQLMPVGNQLEQFGYTVEYATSGQRALALARQQTPLLIVVEKIMPDMDGFEICRILRRESATAGVPIIIASVDADETDRVIGLELGADDYVAKPFSSRELVLRIKKLVALNSVDNAFTQTCLRFDGLTIDIARHAVLIEGRSAELTATEFRLLEQLARRNDYVHRRSDLLERIWKSQSNVDDRTIDTHVRRLRQKLGTAGEMLETVRGIGYRFKGRLPQQHL